MGDGIPIFGVECSLLIDIATISVTEAPRLAAHLFLYADIDSHSAMTHEDRRQGLAALKDKGYLTQIPEMNPDKLTSIDYITRQGKALLNNIKTHTPWSYFDLTKPWFAVHFGDLMIGLEAGKGTDPSSLNALLAYRGGFAHKKKQYRLRRAVTLGLLDAETYEITPRGISLRDHFIKKHPCLATREFLNHLYGDGVTDASTQGFLSSDYPYLKEGLDIIKSNLELADASPILVGCKDWVAEAMVTSSAKYKQPERVDFVYSYFGHFFTTLMNKKLTDDCKCSKPK